MKERYYRPDWYKSPDCPGDENCNPQRDTCPVFGLPGFCQWPCAILVNNYTTPYWYPAREPSLSEKWLDPSFKLHMPREDNL